MSREIDWDWEPLPPIVPPKVRDRKGKLKKPAKQRVSKPKPPTPFRYIGEADGMSTKGYSSVEACKKAALDFYGGSWEEPIYIVEIKSVGIPGVQWKDAA